MCVDVLAQILHAPHVTRARMCSESVCQLCFCPVLPCTGDHVQMLQNGMMNGQYSSQAHQLATVLWFQASMAQASQAAQTQRHQQQGHTSSSARRVTPDMYRGGVAPMNAHSAASLLQQLQQVSTLHVSICAILVLNNAVTRACRSSVHTVLPLL